MNLRKPSYCRNRKSLCIQTFFISWIDAPSSGKLCRVMEKITESLRIQRGSKQSTRDWLYMRAHVVLWLGSTFIELAPNICLAIAWHLQGLSYVRLCVRFLLTQEGVNMNPRVMKRKIRWWILMPTEVPNFCHVWNDRIEKGIVHIADNNSHDKSNRGLREKKKKKKREMNLRKGANDKLTRIIRLKA